MTQFCGLSYCDLLIKKAISFYEYIATGIFIVSEGKIVDEECKGKNRKESAIWKVKFTYQIHCNERANE